MIQKVSKNISLVRPPGSAAYPYSNSLLIEGDPSVLIDAGAGTIAYRELKKTVDFVFLTHYHFDHVNGVSLFPSSHFFVGEPEASVYSDEVYFKSLSGFENWDEIMGYPRELVQKRQSEHLPSDIPSRPGFRKLKISGLLQDGMVIDTGREKITAVFSPGHSHGHFSFFWEKTGLLFSADLDLSPGGPWYGNTTSDLDQLMESVEKLIRLDPERLVTSHRRSIFERQDNIPRMFRDYIQVVTDKENKIYAFLSRPRSFKEIAGQGYMYFASKYNELNSEYDKFWGNAMLGKHLEKMVRSGRIEQLEDGRYLRV